MAIARRCAAIVIVLASLVCYAFVSTTSAQGSITGEWIVEMKPGTDFVYFSIHHRSDRGGTHSSSSDIRADSLKGLSAAQVSGTGKDGRLIKEDVLRHVTERAPEAVLHAGQHRSYVEVTQALLVRIERLDPDVESQ